MSMNNEMTAIWLIMMGEVMLVSMSIVEMALLIM